MVVQICPRSFGELEVPALLISKLYFASEKPLLCILDVLSCPIFPSPLSFLLSLIP